MHYLIVDDKGKASAVFEKGLEISEKIGRKDFCVKCQFHINQCSVNW